MSISSTDVIQKTFLYTAFQNLKEFIHTTVVSFSLALFHFVLNTANSKIRYHGKVPGLEGKIPAQGHGSKCINCSVSLLQNLQRLTNIRITGFLYLTILICSAAGRVDAR
jgi:hypothetical protein